MIAEEELFHLTCGQRWLLHLLREAPEMARPVQRIYRLVESFDAAALLEAVNCTVMAHPALRLQLVATPAGWRQRFIDQEAGIDAEEIVGREPAMRAAYAAMLLNKEASRMIDLCKESPVRIKLIKLDGDCLLSCCIDHMAADETAFDLFERELENTYKKVTAGGAIELAVSDAFLQYLSGETARKDQEYTNGVYWQQQLTDAPWTKHTNDGLLWVPASTCNFHLREALFQRLLNFCRSQQCSVFHLILATQLLLLSEEGGTADIVLNIPVSNRARVKERSVIGNLSMLLHVRFSNFRELPGFQLIRLVRDRVLTAMLHRQYDYAALSHCLARDTRTEARGDDWRLGASFIEEGFATHFPNALFAERLDILPGKSFDIPARSFVLTGRQRPDELVIGMDWDTSVCRLSAKEMEPRFLYFLQRILNEPKCL